MNRAATQRGLTMKSFLLVLILAGGSFYYAKSQGLLDPWLAPALLVDPATLSSELSESQIRDRFRVLKLDCYNENSGLGDRTCWSAVSAYNGTKARSVAFFLNRGRLAQMRVAFDPNVHNQLSSQLQTQHGESRRMGRDIHGSAIVGWAIPNGVIAISAAVVNDQETILLWISQETLLSRISNG